MAILGLDFKANRGDLRNTSAEPIAKGLFERGADIIAHNPFVRSDEASQVLPTPVCSSNLAEAIRSALCTIIVTDHLEYRGLTARYLKMFMSTPSAVVDARHIFGPEEAFSSGLVFRGF